MKVKHLIRELQKCDPEMEVVTEGCDCTGDSYKVSVDPGWDGQPPMVSIDRSDRNGGDGYANTDDTPVPFEVK